MSRPGSVCGWLAGGLLAALAGCGGGGGPDRASDGPPDLSPTPYLQFVHPVSGRALASGARFDVPDSLRPGSAMRPFILPAAVSKPDPVPIAPVPITHVLERQPWPRGLVFNPRTRIFRGTLDPTVEHPPSYRFQYRASAPGHLDVHLSVVLYLPPTLRPDGFEALSFPVGRSTVSVLPAARGGRPPYAYELTGCVVPTWLRREGRALHGSPTAANQHERPRRCRWQVTDFAGGVAEFEIEVSVDAGPRPQLYFPAADGTPLADGAPLAPLGTLVQGERLPPLPAFPRASGARPGTRIDYTVESAVGPPGVLGLPSGLVLDPDRRTLEGIIDDPQWPTGTYVLYFVASAPGYVSARRTVSFDLEDPLRFDAPSAGPFSFPVGEFTQRMLPQAKGGTRPHRYSLEQCPLGWLELVGSELVANPLPEHAAEQRLCRYRVTDAAGAVVELLLRVAAVAGEGSSLQFEAGDGTLPGNGDSLSFTAGEFERRPLPQATGGAPPYQYALEQCPLDWLELVGTELTANPAREHAGEERLCRYRVTDAAGASVELLLQVSAVAGEGSALRFEAGDGTLPESGDSLPFAVGEFERQPLPQAAGGVPPYQYTLEQCPLEWLELVDTELVANPLPGHAGEERLCRYRVTDAVGASVELVLQVSAVAGAGSPLGFDASSAGPFPFTVGEFTREPLPEATGGAPPYQYTLEQCSLAWIEFVGTELVANPRPEHAGEERLCRYRVTDAVGASVELLVQVSAVAGAGSPLGFDASFAGPFTFTVGEFTREPLPEATGGAPPYRYTLEQCPLAWLELVGTELAANPAYEHAGQERLCRFRVTDAVGASVELVLQVSAAGVELQFVTVTEDVTFPEDGGELQFQVGKFERRSLAEATGGVPPYRYSLEQCPLAWLELVGTELAANPQLEHSGESRLCRYRVTDAGGGIEDQVLQFEATPVPTTVFQFENRHIVDRDLPVGSAIEAILLPKAVNPKGRIEYGLRPRLPPGLMFDKQSDPPEINGTPTAISILTRYCIHAMDTYTEGGTTTTTNAAPRCFHLRTVGHEVPRFTVNLQSRREVQLYSELISTNERPPPDELDALLPEVGDTIPMTLGPVWIQVPVAFLPPSWDGEATYSIVPELAPFLFDSGTRRLTSPAHHPLPTPVVYTYGVRREEDESLFAAAICFELSHRIDIRTEPITADTERVWRDVWFTLTFRDEAVRTSTGEYLCHPNPRGDDDPTASSTTQSNPVHDALGMVHARRAVRLAHERIGERVGDSSPGGESVAFHSDVDLARLWGRSGGFSWSGTGESLLAGADVVQPGGALQLGLVAGFHRTALDYRAEARHLEGRYSEGEHVTELYSMHPFAAWRFATDSVVWGSVGAGAGSLRIEDDAPPFDERRRSGLDLRSAALGFRHPLPSSALGTFSFSGLAEHIALRIEGDEAEHGIRPRSLRGSDLGLGLDWRRRPADAEPSLVPSLSLGLRHQSGDGAAGSLIDLGGSIAYRPGSKPLSFDVAASTLLGVAGNDSGSWDVRASARFDPDPGARGLELSLRSVLGAASDDAEAAYGVDGELAYGVFGGAFGSTVRPYVSVSGFAGAGGARRAAGLRLRDEPGYRLSLETYEHTGTDSAGLNVRLHRRWP